MIRITIDEDLTKKLFSSGEVVELGDASGKLLGRIYPANSAPLEGWESVTSELSEEEYRRRLEYDGPGMTTDELLVYLKRDREVIPGDEMIHAKSPRRKGSGSLSSWIGSWRDNRQMLVILLVFVVPFMAMSLAGVTLGWLTAWIFFGIMAASSINARLDRASNLAPQELRPY